MNFEHLLSQDVQEFKISFDGTLPTLAFSGSPFKDISIQDLLVQIEGNIKAKNKLPLWHNTPAILFPPKLNLEQTSSQITAAYKASLIKGISLADLTGGFGVDCCFFSDTFENISHFEMNTTLSQIAAHNFDVLGKQNIECLNIDGVAAIENTFYDTIYIDPSRRHDLKGKVFLLEDCVPNIPMIFDYLMKRCEVLMIKTSPMLDISVGLGEINNVSEIHIVSVKNEVKELLWIVKKNYEGIPKIKTVNLNNQHNEVFNCQFPDTKSSVIKEPQKYLYEPNAAIMKSGAFNQITSRFSIAKLHQHSHLYTNEFLVDFPGRRFIIEKVLPYSKKETRNGITFGKANITTRNFPESVNTLRKKWKIKDGGNKYLFFTTIENEKKIVLICSKI